MNPDRPSGSTFPPRGWAFRAGKKANRRRAGEGRLLCSELDGGNDRRLCRSATVSRTAQVDPYETVDVAEADVRRRASGATLQTGRSVRPVPSRSARRKTLNRARDLPCLPQRPLRTDYKSTANCFRIERFSIHQLGRVRRVFTFQTSKEARHVSHGRTRQRRAKDQPRELLLGIDPGGPRYFDLGAFEFEMGETLPGAKLAYKTQGTLNAARDNAILFPHMYSGTSASMEPFIGVGRPLDPQKHFIILPGQFGNGLSSSPSNTPAPFDRARFPKVTIGDDVRAQTGW